MSMQKEPSIQVDTFVDAATDMQGAIAIIGMAGKFPGAHDVATFWQNLLAGKDTVTHFDAPDGAQDYVGARGVLADVELFDSEFFSIPPREADRMDPQHRLFLEACSNALEDAGYNSHTYAGEIGLYGGCSLNTYLLANLCKDRSFIDELTANYQVGEFQAALGNDKDFLTTRVAYKLNLRGPCVTVQSACATSLVAICQASQALLNFQCDMTLAGGVSITFPQHRGHVHQDGGMASRDGVCRPFDAAASGTVFSHGVGVVVLKRMEDAVRDGDHIAAVIRGFAVNNDGAGKVSYMAPGVDGQARAIAAAQAMAGVSADTISYIEAHGTGTPLGDPIEIAALTEAFRLSTDRAAFCAVGTAKGNVGHLDSAAGVTGVIKTALSLEKKTIPGLAHFVKPNPHLVLNGSPFTFSSVTKPWTTEGPRRAGVSAFGVGGVNAHVVLEEAPILPAREASAKAQVLCVSARTPAALEQSVANLATHLESTPDLDLRDAAFTLACGRQTFDYRFAITANNLAEAVVKLRGAKAPTPMRSEARRLAFTFPGQGSQFVGMGKGLYQSHKTFREVVDRCCALAAPLIGVDLRGLLLGEASDAASEELQQTRLAQPAIFIISLALAEQLAAWGIAAEASVGHSLGEFVAATLCGVFRWEDALRLVCARGEMMQAMEPGAMLSVPLDETATEKYLTPGVSIAGLNSPRSTVLAGTFAAITSVEQALEKDGVAFRRLRTSHAFHSSLMEPMLVGFEAEVRKIELRAPSRPFVSSVTGTWITNDEATSPAYWAQQCRKPVRFSAAVETLRASSVNAFLEVGPGEALTALLRHQHRGARADAPFVAVSALPASISGAIAEPLLAALGELWTAGLAMDWEATFAATSARRVSLPTYPFERRIHWVAPPATELPAMQQSLPPQQETAFMTTLLAEPAVAAATTTASRTLRLRGEIAAVFADLSGVDIRAEEMEHTFLELGLDSLFLTQATQSLQRKFGVKVTFRQLMEQCPTVASLADYLDSTMPADAAPTFTAARPAAVVPSAIATSAQPVDRMFADQLAALSEMFAAQVNALRMAAAGSALPVVAAPIASAPTALAADNAEVKHGSFRPIQARASMELSKEQKAYIADLIAKYEAKTPGSKRHTQNSRAVLADPRAVAGFRPQWKEMVYPLVTDRARGSKIWDIDGNEYIDIVNGYGCIMFGHSPDFVVDAVRTQLERGVAIGPQSVLAGEVAALICELTGNERVTFCNTGSEAVMAAMRVARTVTGRDKIVYFSGDYHGTFDEVLMRSTPRGAAPVAPGIPAANMTNVVVLEYGAAASLEYIRAHGDEIAAVLIEPVQTRHPEVKPFEFIRSVRALTETSGSALILDEVVTGFRLAPGGVQEYLNVRADMCTYGKVIGGGHPIGVLSGKAQYLDALDGGAWQYGDDSAPEVGVTFFAGTFVRHPAAMAAARSVLLHLKQHGGELQRKLNEKTARLAESLDAFFQQRGVPSRVHHFTSWFYFTFPGDAKFASLLYYSMRTKGIHIQEGYPCFLTTAHTQEDFDRVEAAFRETIDEMQAAGVMPGRASAVVEGNLALHPDAVSPAPARVPLTAPQHEIFLAAALSDEANCAFNESLCVHLKGNIRIDDFRFAVDAVLARHDALRSVVCSDGETLCVDPVFSGATEFVDLRALSPEEQQAELAARIGSEAETPFDLHHGPLFRSVCLINSDRDIVFLFSAHHMVLDGWSANQMLEEIGQVYSKGGAAFVEMSPLLPFSSYAQREHQRQLGGEFQANEKYWMAKYEGRSPRLELPTDRQRPAMKTFNGATYEGGLSAATFAGLKQLSAANGCSLYVTLLSSFQLLLHRLTGQQEVVVGISTAGQALLENASLVGHCVNFLPMLSELTETSTVAQHLRATRTAMLDAQDHQEFTFGALLQKLKLERDPSRLPLIEVQFNLEKVGATVKFDGLETSIRPNPKKFVNTDLFLNVVESAGRLTFTCDFNTDLFDEATIDRWTRLWEVLLQAETQNAELPVTQISLLSSAERDLVLNEWNRTQADFGAFEPMHAVFLRNAELAPENTAIECGGRAWTYSELAEYATLLARRIVHEGVKPGALVGICIERSLEMAGAMLAVMMAGATYVPLDPRHPRERLAAIMLDAGIDVLLTGRDPSIDTTARILNITGPQPKVATELPAVIAANDLAYVIYTSGSTGVPKGVAIEHAALVNLLRSMQVTPGLTSDDVLVAITTLAFDIAALEILLPLMSGAKLVIATQDQVNDGAALLALLKTSGANMLQATPGAWRILLDAGWSRSLALKVLCGGEALPRDLADALLERSDEVWNVYGPTETTIWSSATRVQRSTDAVRIGPPIANTQFYVLDEQMQPLPVGMLGELFIGGAGLARGYWKRPELTAEKFVVNPFGEGRLYRTGDLARWHPDGTVQLLGRADFQVKVRGYRIELGDIEAALVRHASAREAVVVQQATGTATRLVGFVEVANSESAPGIDKLRSALSETLPEYMVPQLIVPVARIPRNPNGKVDRKALMQMIPSDAGDAETRVRKMTLPVSEDEATLAAIWSDVLQVPNVSTSDSIFELGADSLAIFRIAARAQREGLTIKATTIFEHRNITAICNTLTKTDQITAAAKTPAKIGATARDRYRLNKVKLDG